MTCQLTAIYAALAAKSVTVGSVTPAIKSLAALPNAVDTALLPCRLLLPVGMPMEGKSGEFIAMGVANNITWVIPDLLLWKPVGQGMGLIEVAADLVAYAAAYANMLATFRNPVGATVLKSWTILPGIFNYPKSSGNWFTGVQALLEVYEVMI